MKIILIAISFFFSLRSAGQVKIVNESLTDSTVDYFYIGVENKISISGISSSNYKINISSLYATLTKIAADEYIVRVNSPTDSCQLSILADGKIIFARYYKVRVLPDQIITLGSFNNRDRDTATIEEILADSKLRVELPGCYFKHNVKVAAYYSTIGTEQTETVHLKPTPGDQLTSWERNRILRCSPGDMIILSNFILNNKISGDYTIPPIILRVKNNVAF